MLLIVYRIDKSQEENSISKVIEETKSNLEGIETNNEAVKKNELKNFELGRKIASKDPEITQVKTEANKSKSDRIQSVVSIKIKIIKISNTAFYAF